MEILTARNLTFTYPKCSEPALKGLSFTVQKGDLTVLCGSTGSGKSTLMSLLKREIAPAGKRSGEILIHGVSVDALSERDSAIAVGYVSQHPEEQIVTDKVWHELAFGLENLGLPNALIRRRVAETASYFGIERWFEQSTSELSGGQKQILNLASVMVMRPEILLLDEPTSQLDPIAASEFISTVAALNRDLGLTVLISEHRLEELLPLSRKTMALRNGEMYAYGETRAVVEKLSRDPLYSEYLPAATRLYGLLPTSASEPPLTVAEGRTLIETVLNEPFDAANPEDSTISTPLREDIDSATPSFNTYSTITSNAAVSTVSASTRIPFDAANPENSTVSTSSRE
ncbi:MAG: ABC transporter ATP-binding protein, partial [Clostridia bacterium]|nr:ABC transporter ATP-binding protein [Clostridia bacterium]